MLLVVYFAISVAGLLLLVGRVCYERGKEAGKVEGARELVDASPPPDPSPPPDVCAPVEDEATVPLPRARVVRTRD